VWEFLKSPAPEGQKFRFGGFLEKTEYGVRVFRIRAFCQVRNKEKNLPFHSPQRGCNPDPDKYG
jgi:hypothetical protein